MITAEQRELRRDRVGSSDTPTILGVDPYRTVADVYCEKVYGLSEIDNEAVRLGNLFEAPLIAWAAEELGLDDVEVNASLSHAGGILAANLDGLSRKHRCIIEGKVTGLSELWGAEGTDEIPDRVIAQALHQVECADSAGIEVDVVWVPVLLARRDAPKVALYRVPRNDDGQKGIVELGHNFWEVYVRPRCPPPNRLPSLDTLKRIRREPRSSVTVDPALVVALEAAKEAKKKAGEAEDAAEEALLAAMGNAEAADFGHPREHYTYLEQARANVDVKRLRLLRPDIFNAFDKTSRFRVLRRSKR